MNDNQLITKESEWIAYFTSSIERIIAKMERMKKDCRPTLGGENFLTDKEVAERLRISRRTLQEYRNEGRISYIQLGGKIIYKESDIERLLKDGYREAYLTDLKKIGKGHHLCRCIPLFPYGIHLFSAGI